MIARLRGLVDGSGEDWVLVDVGGVGYLAYCSARTLAALPRNGEAVTLEIETHVREDHFHLYGFIDAAERDWFRRLTSVQGVGSRVALAIQSIMGPEQLVQALAAADKAAFGRANGVGPKLAGRIVSELKDKAAAFALGPAARVGAATADAPAAVGSVANDAVSALVNLGYGRSEAFGAVARAAAGREREPGLDELIRLGLKELSA